MPDSELMEVLKEPVEIRNPQNQDDDDQAIQDRFDLSLHWDKFVNEPQHNPNRDNCEDHSGKRHTMFSSHFSDSIPHGIVEKLRAIDSHCVGAIRKRRTITPLHRYSSKSMEKKLSHNAHPAE